MPKKLTIKEIINQFVLVHGSLYDYSNVIYKGDEIVVDIKCSIHGFFKQIPKLHKKGSGCQKCGIVKRLQKANKRKITQQTFLKRCIETHGKNKYSYDYAFYKGDRIKVDIKCIEHGFFKQTPKDHWRGFGCPKCANKNVTTKEFVKKAQKIHGLKYDYSKSFYKDSKNKITITCLKHGDFKQIANNHLHGADCPKCSSIKISKKQKELYYTLCKMYLNVNIEYKIICNKTNKIYFADIYIPEKNFIIEYFGDYWHCNPKKYKPDYYHKRKNKYAYEIWEQDKNRINCLKNMGYIVFVVWECDYVHNKQDIVNNIIEMCL